MRLMKFPFLALGVACIYLPLSGCVTSCSGDPRTDSLACASSNLSSGRYAYDTSQMARYASVQEGKAIAASREASTLSRELSSLKADEKRLRAALVAADSSIIEARRLLEVAKANHNFAGSDLSQLTSFLEVVLAKRGNTARSGLEAELKDLEKDVGTLRQMVLTLSGR